MTSKKPVYFSEYFGIDKARLIKLGVFDPILNYDTKVFVEPLLLKDSKSPIIKTSYQNYKSFFANLLLLLQKSEKKGDKCWRTAKNMVDFPEYQYTCIGYSSGTTEGRGSGVEFNDKILQSAIEIVDKADGNPEIFLLLPLLEEGIAGDRISDMAQNIIDDDICRYTQDIMAKIGLEGSVKHTTRNYKRYTLPFNPYSNRPIKLIPSDILLNLPVADDIDTLVEEMAAYNVRLRAIVSRDIGEIWHEMTKAGRKSTLLKELKTNKEFFVETLKALKEYKFEHYDLETDYEGLYKWLENSQEFITVELAKETKNCPDTLESIGFAVTAIIHHFRDTIENKELWRTFWTKCGSEYRHVRVYYSQMLFFTVCNAWLTSQSSNININIKYTTKNIDLEFSVSRQYRFIVHIKHTNNTVLKKNYEKLLEECRGLDNEMHVYLLMNFKDEPSSQLQEVKVIENPICKIFEVDVTKRDDSKDDNLFGLPDIDWGFIEFEGMDFIDTTYIQEKRKGGKKRHERTEIIKDKIIRPMFANREIIKGLSTKQRATNLNNKLSGLQGMNDNELSAFSETYNLDLTLLKGCLDYFSDDKEEQVYKWCLAIGKETA